MLLHYNSKCGHLLQDDEINHWGMVGNVDLFNPNHILSKYQGDTKLKTRQFSKGSMTCLGRMLGRGPWYLTTPVHEPTKKLQIISTKTLWWYSNELNIKISRRKLYMSKAQEIFSNCRWNSNTMKTKEKQRIQLHLYIFPQFVLTFQQGMYGDECWKENKPPKS